MPYKTPILIACLLFASVMSYAAQTRASDNYNTWITEGKRGIQQQKQGFQTFKDEADRQFIGFLKAQWKAYDAFNGNVRDPKPKPVRIPKAPTIVEKNPVLITPTAQKILIREKPSGTGIKIEQAVTQGAHYVVGFFGKDLSYSTIKYPKLDLKNNVSNTLISDFWTAVSKSNADIHHKQLQQYRDSLQLTDWGYLLLVNELGKRIYATSPQGQVLFNWYMLLKAGFNARIAYNSYNIYLLIRSHQKLYATEYIAINGKQHYLIQLENKRVKMGRVFTYEGDYPGALKSLDLEVKPMPMFSNKHTQRKLSFAYGKNKYVIHTRYNKYLIDYLRTYPDLDLAFYLNSGVDNTIGNNLLDEFRYIIKGKSTTEAAELLLRFVQTGFTYQTDKQQFGRENYLFIEETLYYPASDCEDRVVLYAWLVKNLLGLELIGLKYPGHVATAVLFEQEVKGEKIIFNGKKYTIADPTYINANLGMEMPSLKGKKRTIISYSQ
ncbi:MAG: hypothetical protein ACC707_03895 [Thiohalomonadales bacterium]